MARVIQSPTIAPQARRALPAGYEEMTDTSSLAARDDDRPFEPHVSYEDYQHVVAEKESALQKASLAETQLAEIKATLEDLRKSARNDGLKAGRDEAGKLLAEAQAAERAHFDKLCDEMVERQRGMIQATEDAALEVAIAATTKLLGRLNEDTTLLETLVREAMQQVLVREGLRVFLAQADYERILPLMQQNSSDWDGIEFHADSGVELGGCRIESTCGSLDARLERQLEALRHVLLDTAASGRSAVSGDD